MVRTRFAPSPTGYMHIGNLKAALFAYLLAKSKGGKFVLRIEDTDVGRFVGGAVEIIYSTLKIAGIKHDEGPDIGGPYAPYIQSERKNNYIEYAKQLVEKGKGYYCFCTKDDMDSRLKPSHVGMASYDRHCLHLSKKEVEQKLEQKLPYTIRQLIPSGKSCFIDQVFGEISINNEEIEDQILIKSDGMPTYNFANVIDDHLMDITHIMRGSEYLTSTPKYNLLYDAFGWSVPIYAHLPLVLNNKGEKMSKRRGDFSFEDLLDMGFLPKAIVNYIVLLGFSPPNNKEILSLEELIEVFSVESMSKSPASFDINKLRFINSEYIKNMDNAEFYELSRDMLDKLIQRQDIDKALLAQMVKGRISTISYNEISELLGFINIMPNYDIELYNHKKMKSNPNIAKLILLQLLPLLTNFDENSWDNSSLYQFLVDLAMQKGLKNSQVLWSVRTAISGVAATPGGASELLVVLGKTESIERIKISLKKLEEESA